MRKRRSGRKAGERDRGGTGGKATTGVERVREGAACGHGARMPSRCGRCCVGRDGLAWSGRCVNGRWRGGGRQGGCRRQGTGGSGWHRQGGWRSVGGRQWEVSQSSSSTSTVPRFNPNTFLSGCCKYSSRFVGSLDKNCNVHDLVGGMKDFLENEVLGQNGNPDFSSWLHHWSKPHITLSKARYK